MPTMSKQHCQMLQVALQSRLDIDADMDGP